MIGWLALVESNTTGSGRRFAAAALARGLRPVVLTADPSRYPYVLDDKIDHIVVDTSDRDAVLDACARLPGAAVGGVTSSSEYYIVTAAMAAAAHGLPAPDPGAVARCRDKDRQRRLLAAAGIAVPAFRTVTTTEQADSAARGFGLPVVVKPTTGSGSVGVRLCTTLAEVRDAATGLLTAEVNERGMPVPALALVERYVTGTEYSVETFGSHAVGLTRKHLGPPPYFVETGHDYPAELSACDRQALVDMTRSALAALGLGWGAAHTELRLGSSGPVVIEVNPRLAGGMIPALVLEATGIDLVDCCVALAAGHPVPLSQVRTGGAAIRFVVAGRTGRITAVRGLGEAALMPGIRAVELTAREGDRVAAITNSFQDRLGYLLAGGADVVDAVNRVRAAASLVSVHIDQPSPCRS
jgi:biotin carboxylase